MLLGTPIKVMVAPPSAIQAILKKSESSTRVLEDATESFQLQILREDEQGRRAAHRREADGRHQPGHPPGRHDDLHRDPAARERHPHRDAGRRRLREVPHRRRAAVGDAADRQALPQHDHLARQGHGGARHRREAHAAGRPLQAAAAGGKTIDFRVSVMPSVARRGRGHPYSRQGVDQRAVHTSCGSTSSGFPEDGAEAVPQVHRRALRDGAGHRPDRLRQDDDALRGAVGDQDDRRQDHHDRGSGRVPAAAASPRFRSTRRRG